MPYIAQTRRADLDPAIADLVLALSEEGYTEGELNYVISMLLLHALEGQGISYRVLNNLVGVLESAKLEFVRRHMNPYEDEKIHDNGDLRPIDWDELVGFEELECGCDRNSAYDED